MIATMICGVATLACTALPAVSQGPARTAERSESQECVPGPELYLVEKSLYWEHHARERNLERIAKGLSPGPYVYRGPSPISSPARDSVPSRRQEVYAVVDSCMLRELGRDPEHTSPVDTYEFYTSGRATQ